VDDIIAISLLFLPRKIKNTNNNNNSHYQQQQTIPRKSLLK